MHIIVYRKFVHNDVASDVVDFNWDGWCKCRGVIDKVKIVMTCEHLCLGGNFSWEMFV